MSTYLYIPTMHIGNKYTQFIFYMYLILILIKLEDSPNIRRVKIARETYTD